MSDHDELADQREQEADRLERENERVGEGADAARHALQQAQKDELIPAAMGADEPARGSKPDEDPEKPSEPGEPEAEYPSKR